MDTSKENIDVIDSGQDETGIKILNEIEMLTPKDIMIHLKLGRNKTYQLIQLKSFPKIKIGNTYRIPKNEYLKWLEKHMKQKVYL